MFEDTFIGGRFIGMNPLLSHKLLLPSALPSFSPNDVNRGEHVELEEQHQSVLYAEVREKRDFRHCFRFDY